MTTSSRRPTSPESGPSMKNMLEEGFYLLLLLKDKGTVQEPDAFSKRMEACLSQFEADALAKGKGAEAVQHVKYAFCALVDEIILSNDNALRDIWEPWPLQLRHFGEHLAGEGFFTRLDNLRLDPARHVEALEVYHTCLLLGFQGKYLLEGSEKLNYLTSKVGQELIQAQGGRVDFSPHWKPTQRFKQFIRHEFPLWGYYALLGVVAIFIFVIFHAILRSQLQSLA